MILGLGVDLCPIERIEQMIDRHGRKFLDRVYTAEEQQYADQGRVKGERFAARFAAKEAAIKALGAPEGLRWKDMEVRRQPSGVPTMNFHGAAETAAAERGVTRTTLSLSHAGGMAVAVVILEGGESPHVEQ